MEVLTDRRRATARRLPQRAAPRQRGDIMLVVMVFLLVCLLGLVVSMRDNVVSTLMNGNNLARQRDVQVSDVALRQLEGNIYADSSGRMLEQTVAGTSEPWLRLVTAPAAGPTTAYWDACLGNSNTALRCGAVTPTLNGTPLGYTVLAVVQYTGRSDPYGCPNKLSATGVTTAAFYDVFFHVKEANGVTSSNIETVYKLCLAS